VRERETAGVAERGTEEDLRREPRERVPATPEARPLFACVDDFSSECVWRGGRRVGLERSRTRCLVANRATLPPKCPRPPPECGVDAGQDGDETGDAYSAVE